MTTSKLTRPNLGVLSQLTRENRAVLIEYLDLIEAERDELRAQLDKLRGPRCPTPDKDCPDFDGEHPWHENVAVKAHERTQAFMAVERNELKARVEKAEADRADTIRAALGGTLGGELKARVEELLERPIPMLLYCPSCGKQHVDAAVPGSDWDNPPHRSHFCNFCAYIWRPADVCTTGVVAIGTKGEKDHPDGAAPAGREDLRKSIVKCDGYRESGVQAEVELSTANEAREKAEEERDDYQTALEALASPTTTARTPDELLCDAAAAIRRIEERTEKAEADAAAMREVILKHNRSIPMNDYVAALASGAGQALLDRLAAREEEAQAQATRIIDQNHRIATLRSSNTALEALNAKLRDVLERFEAAGWDSHYGKGLSVQYARDVSARVKEALALTPKSVGGEKEKGDG